MTRDEIIRRYPNASESFIRANLSDGDSGAVAKLESNPCNAPLEKKEVQGRDKARGFASALEAGDRDSLTKITSAKNTSLISFATAASSLMMHLTNAKLKSRKRSAKKVSRKKLLSRFSD